MRSCHDIIIVIIVSIVSIDIIDSCRAYYVLLRIIRCTEKNVFYFFQCTERQQRVLWTVHSTLSHLLSNDFLLVVIGNRLFLTMMDHIITNTFVDPSISEELSLLYQELHVDEIEGYFILLKKSIGGLRTYGTVLDFRADDFTGTPFVFS